MVMMRVYDPHHKSPYGDVVNARFEFPMRKKNMVNSEGVGESRLERAMSEIGSNQCLAVRSLARWDNPVTMTTCYSRSR